MTSEKAYIPHDGFEVIPSEDEGIQFLTIKDPNGNEAACNLGYLVIQPEGSYEYEPNTFYLGNVHIGKADRTHAGFGTRLTRKALREARDHDFEFFRADLENPYMIAIIERLAREYHAKDIAYIVTTGKADEKEVASADAFNSPRRIDREQATAESLRQFILSDGRSYEDGGPDVGAILCVVQL